jgi:hypothetical protein
MWKYAGKNNAINKQHLLDRKMMLGSHHDQFPKAQQTT